MKKTNFIALITLFGLIGIFSLTILPHYSYKVFLIEPSSSSKLDVGDVEYLIITTNEYKSRLESLALWKTQKGVTAQIETVEDINIFYSGYDIQEKIKACIEEYHTNDGTEFVLLAGDHQDVPTREVYIDEDYPYDGDYVGCDSYYANLNNWDTDGDHIYAEDDDNWNLTADLYVGRLSANSPSEMQILVNRIILYESNPPVGEWMNSAFFAGSMTYFEADYYAPGDGISDYPEADGNRFFNYVADRFYDDMKVTFLGEDAGISAGHTKYPHNDSVSAQNLEEGITNGTSILGVCGHGNAEGIFRTVWTNDYDGDGLFDWVDEVASTKYDITLYPSPYMIHTAYSGYANPSNMFSVCYLMGCSNGNFTTAGVDSLAEYMLKTVSIGSIGGDRIVWGMDNWTELDYGGFYSEGLAFRFFEQLDIYDQPGKAFALAKQDYCEDNATYGLPVFPGHPDWTQEKWSEKTLKHFNYFGDPELHVWMAIPETLNATWEEYNSSATLVNVFTSGSGPIDGVSVTLTDATDTVVWQGSTNASGQVIIPQEYVIVNSSKIVAYKPRYIPMITLSEELPTPDVPILEVITPNVDRDGTIKLDWSDVTDAISYNVYRDSTVIYDALGRTPIGNPTSSSFKDRGLEDGIYYYVVTSLGSYGESDISNCCFVTVDRLIIPGFSMTILSIVGLVGIVALGGLVSTKIKSRK